MHIKDESGFNLMKYYIDTCIWLNILLEEKRFCKESKEFLHNLIFLGYNICYSGLVLRELKTKLKRFDYSVFREELDKFAERFELCESDKKHARVLEERYHSGYYDMVHLSLCKRLGLILVTRDKRLVDICEKENVVVLEL